MAERKGQFIVNYLRSKNIKEEDIGRRLFMMSDEEFEKIESQYRELCIAILHNSPNLKQVIKKIEKQRKSGIKRKTTRRKNS